MRAHAKLRVALEGSAGGRAHLPVLRSEGALVLRPTSERLPTWTSVWAINRTEAATVRLAAGAAGPLGGDHWRLDIEVGEGATLVLAAVSAQVALPGVHGAQSWSETNISVGRGATLIWSPASQIAAMGCRHAAVSRIDLADGARLFARDEVVIGRYGEQPGNFRQRLRVTRDQVPLYDQEIAVGTESGGWNSAAVVGDRRALGSIVLIDPHTENLDCFGPAASEDRPNTATMRLAPDAVLISSLADDTIALRNQLDAAFAPFAMHVSVPSMVSQRPLLDAVNVSSPTRAPQRGT